MSINILQPTNKTSIHVLHVLLFRSAKAREILYFYDDIISVNCYIITTLDSTEQKCRIHLKSEALTQNCVLLPRVLWVTRKMFLLLSGLLLLENIFFLSNFIHTKNKFMIKLKINIKPIGALLLLTVYRKRAKKSA